MTPGATVLQPHLQAPQPFGNFRCDSSRTAFLSEFPQLQDSYICTTCLQFRSPSNFPRLSSPFVAHLPQSGAMGLDQGLGQVLHPGALIAGDLLLHCFSTVTAPLLLVPPIQNTGLPLLHTLWI